MTKGSFFELHTKLTRSLKKFVLDYESKLEPEVFEAFLESLSEELKAASQVLMTVPTGPERARKLHELVEAEISLGSEIEVSCKKGCSACCHMEVEITTFEADILRARIDDGFAIDRDRLLRQAGRSLQDPKWRDGMSSIDNRCVFLDGKGSCGIYEDRPVMCRRHSVTSPAKNCESIDAGVVIRYFPKVDLLISAANEDPGIRIGPLAKMITL
jgi:Fe-S-cluster containining protein